MSTIQIDETSRAHPLRQRWYRPADPGWAPEQALEGVRRRLHALDPRLEVWWIPKCRRDDSQQPGRWAIMYWMQRGHMWSVVFYWQTTDGAFRPLDLSCCEPILNYLKRCEEDPREQNRKVDEAKTRDQESKADDFHRAACDAAQTAWKRLDSDKGRRSFVRGLEHRNSHAQAAKAFMRRP